MPWVKVRGINSRKISGVVIFLFFTSSLLRLPTLWNVTGLLNNKKEKQMVPKI